ncbi:MAG: hypothetical protein DMG92_18440, partial [Acidobacteria bacterium]
MTAAAHLVAQTLGPEFKDWLNDPNKLIQVIAAADGSHKPKPGPNKGSKSVEGSWSNSPFLLNRKETQQALQLLTRFGELTTVKAPKPELIGSELDRADDKIKNSVLSLLDELASTGPDPKAAKPLLMRAAEQLAIRYALERFESGDVRVNAVHEIFEQMSQQMGNLRKVLQTHEAKMTKAGIMVESHADILDRTFWSELPESSKNKALQSEDAACVPSRNVRQYIELLLQRGDRESACAILANYANAVTSKDPEYRSRVADGIAQLSDLFAVAGGTVLAEATQKLGGAIAKESDPEIEALMSAAFVRLSSEAAQRKQYRAIAQTCEAMDYVASRRPALDRELRSRIGVEGRLPEFIEDALSQSKSNPDLVGVLRRNSKASA